jgi:hypothetical protein
MRIKIKLLTQDEIFFGVRFTISKVVTDLTRYSPEKEYPKAYTLDIGFLLGTIELTFKGSN